MLATANTIDIGTASVTVTASPPTVLVAASALPNPVTGTTTTLSVLGTDSDAGLDLTYTWSATSSPTGSDPTFSTNGTDLSDVSVVTFDMAGDYTFTATISNGALSTTSSVDVTVEQTLTTVTVTPATVDLLPSTTQQFAATALDQFGNAMDTQPSFTWSLAPLSAGTISSTGLYTAPATSGTATVLATANTIDIGTASVSVSSNPPPTILLAATAVPNPVTSTTTTLSALGTDSDAGLDLTYTWAATALPNGADPMFSDNGTNLSQVSVVTFNRAGNYTFTVTISDGTVSTTSSVNVTVEQTLTTVSVTPASANLLPNATQQFTATALDQFGNAMDTQPSFTWSLAPLSDGTISSSGLYTAPATSGTATVLATANTIDIGTASVTVTATPPTVLVAAAATPNPVTGTTTTLSVLGTDADAGLDLTYTWSATSSPAGSDPTFSDNGTALSAVSVVTFNMAGDYTFTATISNGSLSTTSSVNVTVEQTVTTVTVTPASADLVPNATQQFTATALDQFGNAMDTQPTFTWSLAPLSSGTISSSGLYTAPANSGSATVLATANTIDIGMASVTVAATPPTVLVAASANPNPVTGTTTTLSVLGTDSDAGLDLTYTWSATSSPAGSDPVFSDNGTALSAVSVVTFNMAGDYTFTATISNGTLSTTSSVNVVVNQTLTRVSVTPATVTLLPNATKQFTATALDQFGNAMDTQPTFTWSLAAPAPAASVPRACTRRRQLPARPRCSGRPIPSTSARLP